MVENTNHLSAKAGIHGSQGIPAFEAVAKGPDKEGNHKGQKKHKEELFFSLTVKENCHGEEKKLFLCVSVTLWLKLS